MLSSRRGRDLASSRAAGAGRLLAVSALAIAGALSSHHLLTAADAPDSAVLDALHAGADPPAPAPAGAPALAAEPGAGPTRLVVVLIDGLCAKNLDALADEGALGRVDWRARIDVGLPSLSRPVYHGLFTGVPQDVAGIYTNGHRGAQRADGVPDRVREAGGGVAFLLDGVPWLHDLFGRGGDELRLGARARDPTAFARAYRGGARLVVVHITATDHAGHTAGAASPLYAAAAREAAARVAGMRAWAAEQPDADRTTWFVGSDHGHTARGGHGGPELEVAQVTWLGLEPRPPPAGPLVIAEPAPLARLAPTFAAALGLPAPRHALADALPLPGAAARPSASVARRVEQLDLALAERSRRQAGAGAARAAIAAAIVIAFVRLASRSWKAAAACGALVAGVAAGYLAGGSGVTVSAIHEIRPFVLRAFAALAMGAALAWPLARAGGARLVPAVIAAAAPAALAFSFTGGAWGGLVASPVAFFAALLAGLVPGAAVAGVVAAELGLRLAQRAPSRPRVDALGAPPLP